MIQLLTEHSSHLESHLAPVEVEGKPEVHLIKTNSETLGGHATIDQVFRGYTKT